MKFFRALAFALALMSTVAIGQEKPPFQAGMHEIQVFCGLTPQIMEIMTDKFKLKPLVHGIEQRPGSKITIVIWYNIYTKYMVATESNEHGVTCLATGVQNATFVPPGQQI